MSSHLDLSTTNKSLRNNRGRTAYNHEGNQVFRGILAENLEKYQTASTKQQKTSVVNALVEEIKEQSRFVRKLSDGKWVEVAEHVAKEKVNLNQSFNFCGCESLCHSLLCPSAFLRDCLLLVKIGQG